MLVTQQKIPLTQYIQKENNKFRYCGSPTITYDIIVLYYFVQSKYRFHCKTSFQENSSGGANTEMESAAVNGTTDAPTTA